MAPNAAPGSRKRGRPRNDQSESDAGVKKPRLMSSDASKNHTPGALRSLSSAVSSAFGYGQRKVTTSRSVGNGKDSIDKNYEIPDSDKEEQRTGGNALDSASKLPIKRSNGDIDGVYEFHVSDEEPSLAQTPSRKARTIASTGQSLRTTPKSHSLSAVKKATKASKASPQISGRGSRSTVSRVSSRKVSHDDEQAEVSEGGEDGAEDISDSEDVLNTPSAVRTSLQKGAPLPNTNGTTPKLKGILTPSKRLSRRNPKSVAFDGANKKTEDIFFADLPNKVVKSKATSQTMRSGKENMRVEDTEGSETLEGEADEDDEEEEDEEDVVCALCSKPESKPPNQILFCDGCDMAVHQKCYGVARIPKYDWLCNDCSQTTVGATNMKEAKAKAKTSVAASEAMPKIPNFEQHLHSLQRVLLDRCTGKRRIKLCGQDEAHEKTFQLVEQTVMAGEGNSMLIIGARGCGKTTVSWGKLTFFYTTANKWT